MADERPGVSGGRVMDSGLGELALRSFTTFFATVGPIDVAAFFVVLTTNTSPAHQRLTAAKGTAVATALLLAFILFGEVLLRWLGITLPAMRTAGGILLMLLAIDMVFARPSTMSAPTPAEALEAGGRTDVSVFPLATPLIAGPAALGAAVLLAAEAGQRGILGELVVVGALLAVMTIQLALLLVAGRLHAVLGVTGQNVISRVVGILLAALAVQFVFDGVRAIWPPAPPPASLAAAPISP